MVVAQEVVVAVVVVQVAAEAAVEVGVAMVTERNPLEYSPCAGQAQPFVRSLLRTDENEKN